MDAGQIGIHALAQVLVFVFSAFFKAANTALTSLNISRVRADAENEDAEAKKLEQAIGRCRVLPNALEAAALVAALIGGAMVLNLFAFLADQAKAEGLLRFLMLFALLFFYMALFLVLCRFIPGRLARRNAEATARRLLPMVRAFSFLMSPLVASVHALGGGLARLFGFDPDEETEQVTEDEIRMLVDAGEEKGAIEESERDMIENVFDFNNMTAEECMTHRTDMHALWVDDTDENILKTIEETGLSRFPVYEDDLDNIIGTVTTRDYLMNGLKKDKKTLRQLLRPAHFVPESVRTDVLFRNMQHNKYHMAIVVDEYGGTGGLITMEDLLEEIVGNIYDEYDPQAQEEIIRLDDRTFRVEGSVDIERFNEVSGFSLPLAEDYDTVGGLVLSNLGQIPDDGTQPTVTQDGCLFSVEKVSERRIEWVTVQKLEEESND